MCLIDVNLSSFSTWKLLLVWKNVITDVNKLFINGHRSELVSFSISIILLSSEILHTVQNSTFLFLPEWFEIFVVFVYIFLRDYIPTDRAVFCVVPVLAGGRNKGPTKGVFEFDNSQIQGTFDFQMSRSLVVWILLLAFSRLSIRFRTKVGK